MQNQGSNDSLDSDVNTSGQTNCITLNAGDDNTSVDAGVKAIRLSVCEATDFDLNQYGLLFTSGSLPGTDNRYAFDGNGGEFITYANGTARLTGTLENKSNPFLKLELNVRFTNRKDWGEWSAQGGKAKGAHLGPFMTWDFFEIDSIQSTIIGKGNLAGEVFSISHMPASREYGPQLGEGANDRTNNYGMSGWWFFTTASGNYSGTGDFNMNLENCQTVTTPIAPIKLGAMAMLEGPYDPASGVMHTHLKTQGILPVTQPFSAAPWNYGGTETLGANVPESVVDWVLVEMRDANNPTTILARKAGILLNDGQFVQADGFSLVELPQGVSNFYLVI